MPAIELVSVMANHYPEMHHQSTMVKTKEKLWMTTLLWIGISVAFRAVGSSTIACKLRHALLATDARYIKKYADEKSDMESHKERRVV
jgi:hypothetical protein